MSLSFELLGSDGLARRGRIATALAYRHFGLVPAVKEGDLF